MSDGVVATNKTLKTIGENPNLIRPLGNYCVVDIMKTEKETLGGVLLPDQMVDRDKQMVARVISIGPGVRSMLTGEFMPLQVENGDLVILLRHAPVAVPLAGRTVYVVFEGDILGKINEELLKELQAQQIEEEVPNQEVYEVAEGETKTLTKTESGIFVVGS